MPYLKLKWIVFMLKTVVDYPKMDEEQAIIRQSFQVGFTSINAVVSLEQIKRAQELVRKVYMDEKLRNIF